MSPLVITAIQTHPLLLCDSLSSPALETEVKYSTPNYMKQRILHPVKGLTNWALEHLPILSAEVCLYASAPLGDIDLVILCVLSCIACVTCLVNLPGMMLVQSSHNTAT